MDRNSPWGIVCHTGAFEWDFAELHKGGVAFLRLGPSWDLVQPVKDGRFQWLFFDRVVRWAADRGMWILAGLGGTPAWAVDPARMTADGNKYRASAYPPADLTKWDNYVNQVVARYSSKIQYWGIWNEPDSFSEPANVCFWRGSQTEFFDSIVSRTVNILRNVPGANICAPDVAKADVTSWINMLLSRFGANVHAITIHDYKGSGTGTDVIDRARTAKGVVDSYNASHANKVELWITETGWSNWEHTEADISARIQNLCGAVRANPWVRKIFPYSWSDDPGDAFSFKAFPRFTRQQWAGYKTGINAPQTPVPLERDSVLVSHNVPAQMSPGASYNVQMTFRNTGRWTWPIQGTTRLGFGSRPTPPGQPYSIHTDPSDGRLLQVLELISGITAPFRLQITNAAVATNGQVTFSFKVTAPAQPGCHLIAWCLVDENSMDPMWFGQGLLQRLFVQ